MDGYFRCKMVRIRWAMVTRMMVKLDWSTDCDGEGEWFAGGWWLKMGTEPWISRLISTGSVAGREPSGTHWSNNQGKTVLHWGQRKLILAEIERLLLKSLMVGAKNISTRTFRWSHWVERPQLGLTLMASPWFSWLMVTDTMHRLTGLIAGICSHHLRLLVLLTTQCETTMFSSFVSISGCDGIDSPYYLSHCCIPFVVACIPLPLLNVCCSYGACCWLRSPNGYHLHVHWFHRCNHPDSDIHDHSCICGNQECQ